MRVLSAHQRVGARRQADDGRIDLRGRMKGSGRNAEQDFDARHRLDVYGQRPVDPRSRYRSSPIGDLTLHQIHRPQRQRWDERMEDDRRRDVIRNVSGQHKRPFGYSGKVYFQHVLLDDGDAWVGCVLRAKPRREGAVDLDGYHARSALHQNVGERSATRADLDDSLGARELQRIGDPRENPGITEKMLAETL